MKMEDANLDSEKRMSLVLAEKMKAYQEQMAEEDLTR